MTQFLQLPLQEQADAIKVVAEFMDLPAAVLEKDVWKCWVLGHLFKIPSEVSMAFKGGTSLSKVFDAISRFSEDVDITLHHRDLFKDFDPFLSGTSRSKQDKASEILKAAALDHVKGVIYPYLREKLSEEFDRPEYSIEIDPENGEKLYLKYPSELGHYNYFSEQVLLEFGGRNTVEPCTVYSISPYLKIYPNIEAEFPSAEVNVLSPSRTFWEKATLIHSECSRGHFKTGADRISRHWYDLTKLQEHQIGQESLSQDFGLLEQVVQYKKVFYRSAEAKYDDCLSGKFRLVPVGPMLKDLEVDYKKMIGARMFWQDPAPFDKIIERLRQLEAQINEKLSYQ